MGGTHDNNDNEPFISIGLHTLLILNKLTISAEIKEIEKRNMSEDSHDERHRDAEGADEHERGTLANIR